MCRQYVAMVTSVVLEFLSAVTVVCFGWFGSFIGCVLSVF